MKKRRLFSILALVLILSSLLIMPAVAAEAEPIVTPRYVNISLFNASGEVVNSSGKAMCYTYVQTANSSYKIYVTMALQRYKNGEWSNVTSWSGSGTHYAELLKYHYITSGYYYRTAVTATVYTSGGSYVESATTYSQSYYW